MESNMKNLIINTLGKEFDLIKINNDNNEGHGHVLSVKIVLPCYCQAKCPFCFNHETIDTQMHNYNEFEKNLIDSLDMLITTIKNRKITLDVTGNEPTFNVPQFKRFIKALGSFKKRHSDVIENIVLTTNGFNLNECLYEIGNNVDILNISLHHYDYSSRRNIFGTKYIPSNEDLKLICENLKMMGVKTTSVAVIYCMTDMNKFVKEFSLASKEMGFVDSRIRINYTSNNQLLRDLFYEKFENEKVVEQSGLKTKYLDIDGYSTTIYLGVKDLVDHVIGVELVIDDNGKLYLDYNKRYQIDRNLLNSFNEHIYLIK